VKEAVSASLHSQQLAAELMVRANVQSAIQILSAASRALAGTKTVITKDAGYSAKSQEEAQMFDARAIAEGDIKNRIRADMILFESERSSLKLQRAQMQAIAEYNEAIHKLEAALGTSLEKGFIPEKRAGGK
jgi:hypothetical protein